MGTGCVSGGDTKTQKPGFKSQLSTFKLKKSLPLSELWFPYP